MGRNTVSELRLVVTVEDVQAALALFRDAAGMPELARFPGPGQVVLLDAGRATLELSDREHAAHIDELEMGRAGEPCLRVALRVHGIDEVTTAVRDLGTPVLAPITATPWGSRNSRFGVTDDLQLTLFEEADGDDITAA